MCLCCPPEKAFCPLSAFPTFLRITQRNQFYKTASPPISPVFRPETGEIRF